MEPALAPGTAFGLAEKKGVSAPGEVFGASHTLQRFLFPLQTPPPALDGFPAVDTALHPEQRTAAAGSAELGWGRGLGRETRRKGD